MRHLRVLKILDGVQPVAIPMRKERSFELAELGYSTAADLEDARGQGVSHCIVATDTGRHVKDGLAALKSGFDVLIEKPLAINAPDARRLRSGENKIDARIFVACTLRFSESLNTFRDLLPQVGTLHSLRIEAQSNLPDWRPDRDYKESYSAKPGEGGVLLDLIHDIDYAGWIFGWPTSVQARVRNLDRLGIAADEIAEVTWETPTGCIVSVIVDYLSKPAKRRMSAAGSLGTIIWDGINGAVGLTVDGFPPTESISSQQRDQMYLDQDSAFIQASQQRYDTRLADLEDGVKALAVCDAARLASDNRREEQVCYS